ncbi:MAG: STAS domain-containing protein [Iphinoe sp. HA4291-MV1]|jgi:anti-anti-sigma factor|nr:STAS domain-containing protein [Iphinoe sp. HA4291-MV1]
MQLLLDYPKITVISPQGCLNATNALEFETNVTKTLAQDGISFLLVDLEYVESLDSAGLMALVSVLKLAQKLERRFSLCSVSPCLRIIFEMTQLDRVFEIFEGRAAFAAACFSMEEATMTYA